jgi:hypothetical protein
MAISAGDPGELFSVPKVRHPAIRIGEPPDKHPDRCRLRFSGDESIASFRPSQFTQAGWLNN